MPLVPYSKAPLSFTKQVAHLADKGMIFDDKNEAERLLASISYYRLSGYWYPFRVRNAQRLVTDQFEANTHFNDVVALYEFDRQLRTLSSRQPVNVEKLLGQVEHEKRWRAAMGLPKNWREHPLWK